MESGMLKLGQVFRTVQLRLGITIANDMDLSKQTVSLQLVSCSRYRRLRNWRERKTRQPPILGICGVVLEELRHQSFYASLTAKVLRARNYHEKHSARSAFQLRKTADRKSQMRDNISMELR
jgi:hypothetical protein